MNKPKHVLIVRFPYVSVFGGGEVHTLHVIDLFLAHDVRVEFIGSDTTLLKECTKRELKCRRMWGGIEPVTIGALFLFPFTAPFVGARLFWNIFRRKLRGCDTVICISLTDKLLATIPARIFGMRVVWMEHVTFERWLTHNPYRIFYTLFSRLVEIIAISKTIKKGLVELGVPEERIAVKYIGVSLDVPKASHERLDHDVIIGFVGRLSKEKGVDTLLRAISVVQENIPNIRLVLVGDGPERKNLAWLAKELGIGERVQFVGFQRDVKRWMLGFDVVVLPSIRRESFGIVLVEAMVCSRPMIGSRLEGISEIIEHEKTGLLFEPGNVEELTQSILRIVQDPDTALKYITAGRTKARELFSEESMKRELESFFGL